MNASESRNQAIKSNSTKSSVEYDNIKQLIEEDYKNKKTEQNIHSV